MVKVTTALGVCVSLVDDGAYAHHGNAPEETAICGNTFAPGRERMEHHRAGIKVLESNRVSMVVILSWFLRMCQNIGQKSIVVSLSFASVCFFGGPFVLSFPLVPFSSRPFVCQLVSVPLQEKHLPTVPTASSSSTQLRPLTVMHSTSMADMFNCCCQH